MTFEHFIFKQIQIRGTDLYDLWDFIFKDWGQKVFALVSMGKIEIKPVNCL